MASTLKINTLTGVSTAGSIAVTGEGNSTTTNLQQGLSKCWVHYDGTGTPAIADSLNASSITDNGTGDYDINFTNNFRAATVYTAVGNGNNTEALWHAPQQGSTMLSSDVRMQTRNSSASLTDCSSAVATLHGDLA